MRSLLAGRDKNVRYVREVEKPLERKVSAVAQHGGLGCKRERERENSQGEKERGGDYNQASIISKLKTEKMRSHITMH